MYGILYKHTNKINGKVYIGQTVKDLESRCGSSGCNYISSTFFSNAIRKYGWDNFTHEILGEYETKEELDKAEIEMIALYESTNKEKGYNLRSGGSRGKLSMERREFLVSREFRHTEETKRKISLANKGKIRSKEIRKKLSKAITGCKMPPRTNEHLENLSKSLMGHPVSEETRKKLSEKNKGKKLPPRSEEYRKKLSEAIKRLHERRRETGYVYPSKDAPSEETRKKISESLKKYNNKAKQQSATSTIKT